MTINELVEELNNLPKECLDKTLFVECRLLTGIPRKETARVVLEEPTHFAVSISAQNVYLLFEQS